MGEIESELDEIEFGFVDHIVTSYTNGLCGHLAMLLHDKLRWSIHVVSLVELDEPYDRITIHWMIKVPNRDLYLDIFGLRSRGTTIKEWNKHSIEGYSTVVIHEVDELCYNSDYYLRMSHQMIHNDITQYEEIANLIVDRLKHP